MIYQIIRKLRSTNSRTEKEKILSGLSGKEEDLFKAVCIATLEPRITYYVIEYEQSIVHEGSITLETAINSLYHLTNRVMTGHAAINFLENLDRKLSEDDSEVLKLIISGDLKCGVGTKTINKVWPNLVYEHPYMRCSSYNEKNLSKIKFPCFSQTKEDSTYCDIVVDETGNLTYMSRYGKYRDNFSHFINDNDFKTGRGFVYQGECLVLQDNGEYMPRKSGNGYLESDNVDSDKIVYVLWDMIPLDDWKKGECKIPYLIRFNQVRKFIEKINNEKIILIDSIIINNVDEAIDHFKSNVAKGKEGTVIKNLDTVWKSHTSPNQVKLKIEFECELLVTGIHYSKDTKYEGMIGSLPCESSDGLVEVSVGSGLTDEDRLMTESQIVGKIITVKSNDLITSEKNDKKYSLFLPRYIEIRNDKKEADSFNRILEQRDAFVKTLQAIKN